MRPASPEDHPARGPRAVTAGLAGALLAGGLWGLVDGVVAARHAGLSEPLHLAGCLAGAVGTHALLGLLLAVPGLALWRLFGARRGSDPARFVLWHVLALGLFLDVYWWTRPYVLWGVPATDPIRLLAAAGMALASLAVAALVARALAPLARARVVIATLLAIGLAGGAYLVATRPGASERGAVGDHNRDMPNVLLFVVDALRADVLGCYGNERVKTPVMDGLASRGVVFENAFVQAPYTWTSFGSILTGKYPRRHGLVKMDPKYRMPHNVTIPWHLKSAKREDGVELTDDDWASGTFMTGTLSAGSGLIRGFDTYFEALVGHPLVQTDRPWSVFWSELVIARVATKLTHRIDDAPVATQAVRWLRENGRRRFVAMVHYYSTHTPYDPPQRYRDLYLDPSYDGPIRAFYAGYREKIERGEYEPTPADIEQIRGLYYGGVTWADDMIGDVLAELERQGVLDDTLVIVTSDHGEELNDHGLWEHNWMYQTNLRVPLIMSWPRGWVHDARVSALVETVDIVPTVCELAGLPAPHDPSLADGAGRVDGVSLVGLARGEVEAVKEFAFSENGLYLAIQDRDWKLVIAERAFEAPDPEGAMLEGEREAQLYDLVSDPDETRSVLDEHPDEARRLLAELVAWNEALPHGREVILDSIRDTADEELMRRLEALGYVDGVGHGMGSGHESETKPR